MFIIKLGAEALNRLEEQLTINGDVTSKTGKNVKGSHSYSTEAKLESSILYNLLSCDDQVPSKPQSHLFPDYDNSGSEVVLHPRSNTISYSNEAYYDQFKVAPRPYSAPELPSEPFIKRIRKRKQSNVPSEFDEIKSMTFHQNCKISSKSPTNTAGMNSPAISCSTDSFVDEPMDLSRTSDHPHNGKFIVDSWLFKCVSLISSKNSQFSSNLAELPPNIRLHLLQSSWHRVIITYLFEYLMKFPSSFSSELMKFLQSVTGVSNQSILSKKNMSCMYKSLVDELNIILYQIRKLDLDEMSMNFLRIGLLLTGNQDEGNQRNLKLIEQFIQSKIYSHNLNLNQISDLLENLLKINSIIIETLFYGHLEDSVENVFDQLFVDS